MLVLQRKVGEKLIIGEEIEVSVEDVRGRNAVRLGVQAPPHVKVLRGELAAKEVDHFDPFVVPVTRDWLTLRLGHEPKEINACCFRWRPRAVATQFEITWDTDTKALLVCVIPSLPPERSIYVVQLFDPTQGQVERVLHALHIRGTGGRGDEVREAGDEGAGGEDAAA